MNFDWEQLADGVFRCRLPFLDVTVGLVCGRSEALLVDTGTTLAEAEAIKRDVSWLTSAAVRHVVLTHHHFDHVLGSSVFTGAAIYCAPEASVTMCQDTGRLRADALGHGAAADEVDRAIAALRVPTHPLRAADIDLGARIVRISHPGLGHTDHDLIVVVPAPDRVVVFCGDLVEESAEPVVDAESHPAAWPSTLGRVLAAGGADAAYVPGHGAVVDADYVERQRRWLQARL